MRVALDGTPLLGRRTGIGRYTENLLAALAVVSNDPAEHISLSATAFTLRGAGALGRAVPDGVAARSLPVPARALRSAWSHLETPPVGLFSGRVDVFHGTNFVLPPTGRAGGVVTIHDLAYLTMPQTVDATSRALRELVPRSLARAAVVCTPTRAVADLVLDAYGPATPEVMVTPLGVDPHWFTARAAAARDRPALGLPADYFLFVGTREPRKDLATLLRAYRSFRACWTGAPADVPSLLLVGPSGWGTGEEIGDGVQLRDYAPTAELRMIVASARAVVMPSRDEGFGLPALEGLATGVEVIVSDVPALLEVTGGHARVFRIGDADGLAAELTAVASSGRMAESGTAMDRADGPDGAHADTGPATPDDARRVRQAYAVGWTWERCAAETIAAYRIAGRSRR